LLGAAALFLSVLGGGGLGSALAFSVNFIFEWLGGLSRGIFEQGQHPEAGNLFI